MANPNTLPLDSLILVTAANGLIASHVADQLLAAGYRVRGTVRDLAKCQWMTSLFDETYGPGKFELVRVSTREEMTGPALWDDAMRGVSGVAHVLGAVDMTVRDVDASFADEWPMHAAVLDAAKRCSHIRAFVFTSSAWAVYTPDASIRQTLTAASWNEEALAVAAKARTKTTDPSQDNPKYMLAPYMALKTRLEQGFWQWCLAPTGPQGVPSTAGMVRWVWDGTFRQVVDAMQPQWHVDAADAGRLYVATLTQDDVRGERVFGFGDRFSWFQVHKLLSEWYGDSMKIEGGIVPVAYLGVDQTDVPGRERGRSCWGGWGGRKGGRGWRRVCGRI
ncbi:aldehyde reductase [Apiospora kogelbergensis]|uniref:aldehyde reductase n=1 Tax=Apiospora kogelbergensis TaxID=1337665 RepID=UPI00312DBAB2